MKNIQFKIQKLLFFNKYSNFKNAKVLLFGIPSLIFGNRIKLGENIRINEKVFIHAEGHVFIDNNVTLSYGTTILTTGYCTENWKENCVKKEHFLKSIEINKNVWICANCTILPGVKIAEGIIVLPGSVVSKSLLEEYCLYGGVPAVKIKEIY